MHPPGAVRGRPFPHVDVIGNKEISPSFPGWLAPDGQPVAFSKLDDYAVQFKFAGPYGLFMSQLPSSMGLYITL